MASNKNSSGPTPSESTPIPDFPRLPTSHPERSKLIASSSDRASTEVFSIPLDDGSDDTAQVERVLRSSVGWTLALHSGVEQVVFGVLGGGKGSEGKGNGSVTRVEGAVVRDQTTVGEALEGFREVERQQEEIEGPRVVLSFEEASDVGLTAPHEPQGLVHVRSSLTSDMTKLEIKVDFLTSVINELEIQWFARHICSAFRYLRSSPKSAKLSDEAFIAPEELDRLKKYSTSVHPGSVQDPYPGCEILTDLMERQALESGEEVALDWSESESDGKEMFGNLKISFEQLVRLSKFLALEIRRRQLSTLDPGSGPTQFSHESLIVPLCLSKSPTMIISMLAVWYLGKGYTNMEPDIPRDRKVEIVTQTLDLGPRIEVEGATTTTRDGKVFGFALVEKGQWDAFDGLVKERGFSIIDPHEILRPHLLRLHSDPTSPISLPDTVQSLHAHKVTRSTPAYVVYTSGSTGKPKGVLVTQGNVGAFLRNYEGVFGRRWDGGRRGRVLQFPSYGFDVMVMNVWITLVEGATLCMTTKDSLRSDLSQVILDLRITHVDLTPTVLALLLEAFPIEGGQSPEEWRKETGCTIEWINTGAESVSRVIRDEWCKRGVVITNDYGPSETTVGVISTPLTDPTIPYVPIGRPTGANIVHLLNPDSLKPVPLGAVGEICIGGDQVTDGYLNTSANEGVFVDGSGEGLGRIYRTGDLGRYLSDGKGSLECLGRKDSQVKVNGLRIEVGEIEQQLNSHVHPSLVKAVVDKVEADSLPPGLVAFLEFSTSFQGIDRSTSSSDSPSILPISDKSRFDEAISVLKKPVLAALPTYMCPRYWLPVSGIPLQPSGKTDRKALRKLAAEHDFRGDIQPTSASSSSEEHTENSTAASSFTEERADPKYEDAIRDAWSAVLRIPKEKIGPRSEFTQLGGDSIAFIKVIGRLRKAGFKVSFSDLANASTLAQGASALQRSDRTGENGANGHPAAEVYQTFGLVSSEDKSQLLSELEREFSVSHSDVEDIYPTSPSQDALLAASMDTSFYYAQAVYTIDHRIPPEVLATGMRRLLEKREMMRKAFWVSEITGRNMQVVYRIESDRVRDIACAIIDVGEEELGKRIDQYLKEDRESHVFEFARIGIAFQIFRTPKQSKLVWSMHHAMSDGWTLDLLSDDLRLLCGEQTLPPRPPFAQFVRSWSQHSPPSDSTKEFWRRYLQGAKGLSWPPGTSRGTTLQTAATVAVHWGGDLSPLSKEHGITPAIATRVAAAISLAKQSGGRDLTLGIVRSGRDIDVPECENMIGPCVSVLPARFQVEKEGLTYLDLLKTEARSDHDARSNQQITIPDIAKICSIPDRQDLYKTLLTYQSLAERVPEEEESLPRPISEPPEAITMPTNYALSIEITPRAVGNLELNCFYDGEMVPEGDVRGLMEGMGRVLDAMVGDPNQKLVLPRVEAAGFGQSDGTAPEKSRGDASQDSAPGEKVEEIAKRVVGHWAAVLKCDPSKVSRTVKFGDLGGDSITTMRLSIRLKKDGLAVPIPILSGLLTVEAQARWLAARV